LGHLTSVSTAALGTTPATVNTYSQLDTMGRVLASSQQIGSGNAYGFTYAYDHSGALASTLYPSGRTVTNTFDSSGRISAVNGTLTGNPTTPYAANVQYAAQGPVQSLTMMNSLGNNVLSESWSFNARQQPSSLTATSAGGTQLMNLGWTYSPSPTILTTDNGDILTHTIARSSGLTSPVTQNFSYADPSNRLSSAYEGSSVWSQSYGYDAFGNRAVTAGVWPGLTPPMPNAGFTPQTVSQFNNQNQWKRGAGDSYDAAGNQLSVAQFASFATAGSTFSYDGENRLLTANMALQGGPSFVYDGEGRRVQKTSGSVTITYIHDAKGDLAAEYSTAPDPAVGTQYLSDDHLGSTRLITDWNGIPQRCFDYLPFGEEIPAGIDGRVIGSCYEAMNTPAQYPTSADVVNQKFTGKERDSETGLDYFGARYMSSAQGRWTSPDVVNVTDERLLNPGSTLNKYAYAANNPLKYIDPDGRDVTYFYDKGGIAGHSIVFAYNQATGDSAIEDFGPRIHAPIWLGHSMHETSEFQSADDIRANLTALTIQTTPEVAQEVINYIRANPDPALWTAVGPNCSTAAWKVLAAAKLAHQGFFQRRANQTPRRLWENLIHQYNPGQEKVTPQNGKDYGHPTYNMFDLLWLSLPQSEPKGTVTVTNCIKNPDGTTTCTTWK